MVNSIYTKRLTTPSFEPVTVAELKTHLKITHSDEDTYLEGLIKTCRLTLEQYTQRIWCNCQLQLSMPDFTYRWCELPYAADNTVVASVKYKDEDGVETTIASTEYNVITEYSPAIIKFKSSFSTPSVNLYEGAAVKITYTTGAASAAGIGDNFKYALLLYAAYLYENREAMPYGVATRNAPATLPMVVQNLLVSERIHGFLSSVLKG